MGVLPSGAMHEESELGTKSNIVIGFILTVVVHVGLVAGALFLHKDATAEAEPKMVNLVAAQLVKLGMELPPKVLPKLEMAAAPAPKEVGQKFTEEEKVQPEPEKKVKPPKREKELEEDLSKLLARNTQTAGQVRDGSNTSKRVGTRSTTYGQKDGDRDGVVTSRDKIEGNQWVAAVRRALFNVWDIPTVIPDGDLARLSATVAVKIDESGGIKSWSMKVPASGSSFAGLFNNSVQSVKNKISQLPAPPPGALKMFPNGIALKFQRL